MSLFTIQTENFDPILRIDDPTKGGDITFYVNTDEFLKINNEGFYVRGKKLDIDDNEANSVYKAFREFLILSALLR